MAITGRCHCGDNTFRIDGEIPATLARCTCSYCARIGVLRAYYAPDRFEASSTGHDATYRWNTKLVAHHFCGRCGCFLYSDSPDFQRDGSWDGETRRIGANARLFDDYDAAAAPVEVLDGKNLW